MPAAAELLPEVYRLLLGQYGPQGWWPADTPFEVCVGAILTQNTNWRNVERAIANLKEMGVLTPAAMGRVPLQLLAEAIRPAGYYNVKAARLKEFVDWLDTRCCGEMDALSTREWETLRRELLGVRGIGPETADSMLLYAGECPTFVVDAYTRRLLQRLGALSGGESYEDVRGMFMGLLPADTAMFREYHALIVCHGKERCRKTPRPDLCLGCLLGRSGHCHCLHPVAPLLLGPVEGFVRLPEE